MHTRDTAIRVRGMPRCVEINYPTRTHDTRFGNTAGKPVTVAIPSHVPEDDQNDCLLPNLRVLRLDIYSRKIGKVVADMIKSRRCLDTNISGNVLLETVVFSERFIRLDKATISRLISCSNGGLNVYQEFFGSPIRLERR